MNFANALLSLVLAGAAVTVMPSAFAHESSCETQAYKESGGKLDLVLRNVPKAQVHKMARDYFQNLCNAPAQVGNHRDGYHKCSAIVSVRMKTVYLDAASRVEKVDVRFMNVSCRNAYGYPNQVSGLLRKCPVFRPGAGFMPIPGDGALLHSPSETTDGYCLGKMVVAADQRDIEAVIKFESWLGKTLTIKYQTGDKPACNKFQKWTHRKACELEFPDVLGNPSGYVIFDEGGQIIDESLNTKYDGQVLKIENSFSGDDSDV